LVGRTLDHCRITGKLRAAVMGEVYRAEDVVLSCEVAIKVMPDLLAGDPERLDRFEREAKVLASLNHPNIATIHGLEDYPRPDGFEEFKRLARTGKQQRRNWDPQLKSSP
jgi:serine/threonine protein kinase